MNHMPISRVNVADYWWFAVHSYQLILSPVVGRHEVYHYLTIRAGPTKQVTDVQQDLANNFQRELGVSAVVKALL